MTEQEAAKLSADLLRKIIRSIDKRLEYKVIESAHEGRFALQLTVRGRIGCLSLLSADLRSALVDDARKNAIRQKLKSTRDNLLSNYQDDVVGTTAARILKQATKGDSDSRASFFYTRPRGRR